MDLIALLQKLGILRVGGTAATYTQATDRPMGLQMDGVINEEKDLVTKQDVRGAADAVQ
ncbi:MAG: hypothetical protein GX803_08210 [Lentisphaerae bacterium]|jgi:hypothetical protein|nr:hypothetical protein [Lentisphaerota bacterium]